MEWSYFNFKPDKRIEKLPTLLRLLINTFLHSRTLSEVQIIASCAKWTSQINANSISKNKDTYPVLGVDSWYQSNFHKNQVVSMMPPKHNEFDSICLGMHKWTPTKCWSERVVFEWQILGMIPFLTSLIQRKANYMSQEITEIPLKHVSTGDTMFCKVLKQKPLVKMVNKPASLIQFIP